MNNLKKEPSPTYLAELEKIKRIPINKEKVEFKLYLDEDEGKYGDYTGGEEYLKELAQEIIDKYEWPF